MRVPTSLDSSSPRIRAAKSAEPPVAKPTSRLIGLSGYVDCAAAHWTFLGAQRMNSMSDHPLAASNGGSDYLQQSPACR